MSKEEKTRLVSPEAEKPAKMAEEVHPEPGEMAGTSSKRGSKADVKEGGDTTEGATDTTAAGTGQSGSVPGAKRKRSCPVYFGVKSYLHHFYDNSSSYKDPNVYEDDDDDDDRSLLQSAPRRRRCPPIWWKVFMWLGVNLLLLGVVGILLGYLLPPKTVVVGQDRPRELWYIDTSARSYNVTLDLCKLIGLVLFCVGGLTLAMALLFPSFLHHYCRDDDDNADDLKVPLRGPQDVEEGGGMSKPPLSPVEMTIPASSKVKSVQPPSKVPQAMLEQAQVVEYKD